MPYSVAQRIEVVNKFLENKLFKDCGRYSSGIPIGPRIMNEKDKRVIRTRSQLAQALIDLSCQQGYEAVTIQSITDRAGVNYRTFYRHYESKDALLQDVLRNTMGGLRKVMPPPTATELADSNFEAIARRNGRILYEYVAANSVIFEVLLQSGTAALVPIQEFARAQTETYFAEIPSEEIPLGEIPFKLVAHHMISSTFAFIKWWLDDNMSYSPEQMGDYAAQLIMLPIRRLLVGNGGRVAAGSRPDKFLGKWEFVPDQSTYEMGSPPLSGTYEIVQDGEKLIFKMVWRDVDGESHELAYSEVCDGKFHAYPHSDIADEICLRLKRDDLLTSSAKKNGEIVLSAERELISDADLKVTMSGLLPDGSDYRNVAMYKKLFP